MGQAQSSLHVRSAAAGSICAASELATAERRTKARGGARRAGRPAHHDRASARCSGGATDETRRLVRPRRMPHDAGWRQR
mmetsp:Transcript_9363/g.27615  ORF Transcript_9363/g.27615 Transcript_9363/m.27615 type:complete len:80 (-) Transcript_9363:563-802(-)